MAADDGERRQESHESLTMHGLLRSDAAPNDS